MLLVSMSIQLAAVVLLTLVNPVQQPKLLPKPLSASTIFQRESRNIATIRTRDNLGNPIGQGSGIVVSANPKVGILIATNLHVLRGACSVSVDIPGEEARKPVLGVAGLDSDNDVVLITVGPGNIRRSNIRALSRAEIGSEDLRAGDAVYAIGNPMGFELTITDGIVSGIRETLQGRRIQITAPISPGSSGGGLYNRFGWLVGITTSSVEGAQNLNFAVPIEAILDMNTSGHKDWYEAKDFFCKSGLLAPTFSELQVVLGMHVAHSNVVSFFTKLGEGTVPLPFHSDKLPSLGDTTYYRFYLGITYSALDGVIYSLDLFGPGAFGRYQEHSYRGDLPFGLRWGMSEDEVRKKLGKQRNDRELGDASNKFLIRERGRYIYTLTIDHGRLTHIMVEIPLK